MGGEWKPSGQSGDDGGGANGGDREGSRSMGYFGWGVDVGS